MSKIKALTIGLILLSLVGWPAFNAKAGGINTAYNLVGENDNDLFGYPVAFLGDVNNDTFQDFAVGAVGFDNGSIEDAGKVYIYSGQDGSVIRTHVGTLAEGFYGSVFLGIGDINSDGYADYAILDPRYSTGEGGWIANEFGRIIAYSGLDSQVLWTHVGNTAYQFQFGSMQMVMTGDFNADGKPDIAVGAPGLGVNAVQAGGIIILSAADGTIINQYNGTQVLQYLGTAIDSGYDLNGDGTQDFIIGEPNAKSGIEYASGIVRVISGADLSTVLRTFTGVDQRYAGLGGFVNFAGDTNKDGTVDIAVGSHESIGGVWGAGAVYLFSGATGSQLAKYAGSGFEELFGANVVRVGDTNNDGYADIGAASLQGTSGGFVGAGRTEIYSGKTNSMWGKSGGGAAGELMGSDIRGMVDVNKDGILDLVVGSVGGKFGLTYPGRARLFFGNHRHTPYGSNIEVHPIVGRQADTVTYATVSTEGDTTATFNGTTPGTSNFKTKQGAVSEYWSISTSAVYSGNITICVKYNQALYADETKVGLLKGVTDITTSRDTTNDIVCGVTTSF